MAAAIADSDALLVSAGPSETGDGPVLTVLGDDIRRTHLSSVILLSTIGVYGDSTGAWIDETAP